MIEVLFMLLIYIGKVFLEMEMLGEGIGENNFMRKCIME